MIVAYFDLRTMFSMQFAGVNFIKALKPAFLYWCKNAEKYILVLKKQFLATNIKQHVSNLSIFVAHFGILVAHFGIFNEEKVLFIEPKYCNFGFMKSTPVVEIIFLSNYTLF